MDNEQLQQWILRRLGSPLVKVELTCEMIQDDIDFAKRWFAAKKGVRKLLAQPIQAGMPAYTLDPDIDTVLDVVFPENNADLTLIFSPYLLIDEKVPYDVFAAPNAAGIYSTFTQTLQFVEMAKRVLSADSDWKQEGNQLFLSPVPRYTGNMILEYKSHNFTIEQLPERDHDMLKRFALARAKQDLSMIRGKYPAGFPGAQGTVELDWQRLHDDAEKEIESLDKEIMESAFPMPFLRG
jgi:hypothetical protein